MIEKLHNEKSASKIERTEDGMKIIDIEANDKRTLLEIEYNWSQKERFSIFTFSFLHHNCNIRSKETMTFGICVIAIPIMETGEKVVVESETLGSIVLVIPAPRLYLSCFGKFVAPKMKLIGLLSAKELMDTHCANLP